MTEAMTGIIDEKEIRTFLETHRDIEMSPAKMEFTLHLNPEMAGIIRTEAVKHVPVRPEDTEMAAEIEAAGSPEELLRLMRKPMQVSNRDRMRERILEMEDEIYPLVQNKCLTVMQDVFIENALYFFLNCREDSVDWICDTYDLFRSDYLKSMLCLVLGFRGSAAMIPFLMGEAERLESRYPNESYDQGPTLAVHELAVRFLDRKVWKNSGKNA